jgi:phosphohistidine phosphatase SixA
MEKMVSLIALVLLVEEKAALAIVVETIQTTEQNDGTSNSQTQPAYRLTVLILSHLPGTSTVGVYITTKNGYTDQANVPTTGIASWTFDIPQNQGNWVRVCSNYCLDMSVSFREALASP